MVSHKPSSHDTGSPSGSASAVRSGVGAGASAIRRSALPLRPPLPIQTNKIRNTATFTLFTYSPIHLIHIFTILGLNQDLIHLWCVYGTDRALQCHATAKPATATATSWPYGMSYEACGSHSHAQHTRDLVMLRLRAWAWGGELPKGKQIRWTEHAIDR